jgi:ubiquinol-cytochrome c reductase cytochrome c1 subunit
MILGMPRQLHDGMIEYDDGTPSSTPQMAHDISEYLAYLARNRAPDQKLLICLTSAICLTFYPISYFFTKYHYVNTYSFRFEAYAVKNGGYKKFREKMFKSHKMPGNWLGQFS